MANSPAHSSSVSSVAGVLRKIQLDIRKDSGAKAELKRVLTGEPRHQRAAYPLVFRYLHGPDVDYHLDQWLWVVGFLAYYDHQEINPDQDRRSNFGDSVRRLRSDNGSGGPERRFRSLLDTSLEDLRSPLTSLVRLMKSKGVIINYPQLLVDLRNWEHPDQYVQDKWARAFWNAPRLELAIPNSEGDEGVEVEL